jgi:hypothetical protein
MPRKSAAAARSIDPRGHRLDPPPGLSAAERKAFAATVASVRGGHFAAEDLPILAAYAAAIVQERDIAQELDAMVRPKAPPAAEDREGDEKARDRLRAAHARVAGSLTRLARALRLGAMARNPSRSRRRPGMSEPSAGPLPWEYEADERLN